MIVSSEFLMPCTIKTAQGILFKQLSDTTIFHEIVEHANISPVSGYNLATRSTSYLILNFETSMENFTPLSATAGGALIGISVTLLLLFNGRIGGLAAS